MTGAQGRRMGMGVVVLIWLGLWNGQAGAALVAWEDCLAEVADGSALESISGWSIASGTNSSWLVCGIAGHAGCGILAGSNFMRYERELTGTEIADHSDSGFTYEARVQLAADGDDRYAVSKLEVMESGGVNGFTVCFDGQSVLGPSDNRIRVSSGGTSWGNVTWTDYAVGWEAGIWYAVRLCNIQLPASGVSGARTAQLTVFETDDPSNVLLSEVPVTAFGNNTFDKVDLLSIQEAGACRTTYIDEIGLSSTWQDRFSQVSDGTALENVTGWSHISGSSSWLVSSDDGYTDQGIAINAAASRYDRTLSGSEIADFSENFIYEAKVKLSNSGDDRYEVTTLNVWKSDGVNGFTVKFQGQSTLGPSDNRVGVSSGGTSWGNVSYDYYNVGWQTGVWYTVRIYDFSLLASGAAGSRTAQVKIFETDHPLNVLLEPTQMTAYGNNSFDQVDLLSIYYGGANRLASVDDIGLQFCPPAEPITFYQDLAEIESFDAGGAQRCTVTHGSDVDVTCTYGISQAQTESTVLEMIAVRDDDPNASNFWATMFRPVSADSSWLAADGIRLKYTADISKRLWLSVILATPEGQFSQMVEPMDMARYVQFEDRLLAFDDFVNSEGFAVDPSAITEIRIQSGAPTDILYFDSLSLYKKVLPDSQIEFHTNHDDHNLFFPGDDISFTFTPESNRVSGIIGFRYEVKDTFGKVVTNQTVALVAGQTDYVRTFTPPKVGFFEVHAWWVESDGTVHDPRSCLLTSGSIPAGLATFAVMPNTAEANMDLVMATGTNAFLGSWGCHSDLAPEYQGIGLQAFIPKWKFLEPVPPDRSSGMAPWAEAKMQEDPEPAYAWGMCHLQANLEAPEWAAETVDDGVFPPNIQNWSDFEAFARDAIQVYKHLYPHMNPRVYVAAWEVNLDATNLQIRGYAYTPDDVVELHHRVRALLDEEDPGSLLLGPATSSPVRYLDWNEPVFQAGLLNYVDGYICHAYHTAPPETSGLVETLASLRAMFSQYAPVSKTFDIYVDEASYLTHYGARDLYREHADLMVRFSLILKGEGCKVFYPFYPIDFSPTASWGANFNLDPEVETQKDSYASRTSPKPTYPALAACAKLTEGCQVVGNLRYLGEDIYGYVYEKDTFPLVVIWSMTPNRSLSLPAGSVSQVKVADMMGNETSVGVTNGMVSLLLGPSPQYIRGLDPELYSGGVLMQSGLMVTVQ